MRGRGLLAISTSAAVLVFAASASAGVSRVWAVNDGEKIERDDHASPLKAGNSAWDGSKVRLLAARNEVIAFQLIVEADRAGIDRLSVALPELASATASIRYAAPAGDPTDYVGRPIQIFSVHYLEVTHETHADWAWKPGSPAFTDQPALARFAGATAASSMRHVCTACRVRTRSRGTLPIDN